MSIQAFEAIAREAERNAQEMNTLARRFSTLGESAQSVIGGTASGADRTMLALAAEGARHARASARSFEEAVQLARRSAQELRERAADSSSTRTDRRR